MDNPDLMAMAEMAFPHLQPSDKLWQEWADTAARQLWTWEAAAQAACAEGGDLNWINRESHPKELLT